MKKIALLVVCVSIASTAFSQVITVSIDTLRYFEHSSYISTPQARETEEISLLEIYRFPEKKIIAFDLDKEIQIYEGKESPITVIHETDNVLDIEVMDNGFRKLVFLGKNTDGSITYLEEYFQGDKTKGFFSINPQYT
ncbi:MAG: hypothetical protein ACKO7B_08585, partial [Flavobacteriales bacterium]